jgi:hypothetical protein
MKLPPDYIKKEIIEPEEEDNTPLKDEAYEDF